MYSCHMYQSRNNARITYIDYFCCVELPLYVLFSSSSSLRRSLPIPPGLEVEGLEVEGLFELDAAPVISPKNEVIIAQMIVKGVSSSQRKELKSPPGKLTEVLALGRTSTVAEGAI